MDTISLHGEANETDVEAKGEAGSDNLHLGRREMLKTIGAAAAGMAAGALPSSGAAEVQANEGPPAAPGEHNAYGAPPGTGISMPPYYMPTPSVKNKNNYFPQSEPLGPDEMRIIFMGSNPGRPA